MQSVTYGQVARGNSPIVLAAPHIGTTVPEELLAHPAWKPIDGRLSDPAGVALLAAAKAKDITSVIAQVHPCVVDFNVALDNRPLSPGLNRTGLCRTHTSRGEALYPPDCEPDEGEVKARVERYWCPFHAALTDELLRLRDVHGHILLLVSHASSWLSPYRSHADAADCNAGSHQGTSCDRRLVSALTETVQGFGRSWVLNGKFADVFAAHRYGMPQSGIHVVEVEVAARWRNELESSTRRDDASARPEEMHAVFDALAAALKRLPPADARFVGDLITNGPVD